MQTQRVRENQLSDESSIGASPGNRVNPPRAPGGLASGSLLGFYRMAQAVPSPLLRLDGVQPHLAPAAVLESRVDGHLRPHLDGVLRFSSWYLLSEDRPLIL